MRSFFMITRYLLLVTFFASVAIWQANAADNEVVAEVGSVSITKYEIGREFQRLLPLNSSFHSGISKEKVVAVKEEALENCIERALKVMYALDNEIVVDASLVKRQYDKIRSKYDSDGSFRDALAGETPEAFRSSLFRYALAQVAEKVAVDDKVTVSDEEIRKFYDENPDKFIRPVQYKASHILVKVDPASNKEQRQERLKFAQSLLEKARAGEDFYDLAYYNSDDRTKFVGGDLGFFSANQVVPEFADAVKKMKVGEISDVVETLNGYHIIKLVEIKPSGRMSFAEVRATIVPQMKKAHRDKIYERWIAKLRDDYPVKKLQASD